MGEPSKDTRLRGIHDYTFLQNAEGTPLNNEVSFLFYRPRVTQVSLSDWLALQARIRGSKDPRLLRDRPSDGAALHRNLCGVCGHYVQVTASIWRIVWGSLVS